MADNYCKCRGCRHVDPNERSGYKWYCTWYRSYEDPDCLRECSHFSGGSGGGCFLTTACCQYKGLPDDWKELTALRAFRDEHLAKTEAGKVLVEEYYRIATGIVEKLESHPEKAVICEKIYEVICKVMELLEQQNYESAVSVYQAMVLDVQAAVGR